MITKYKQQVIQIASDLGCELHIDAKFRTTAMMYVEHNPPYIEVPPVTDQISYLINLHELGHVFYKHEQAREYPHDRDFYFRNGVLKSEAQAWDFTLEKCINDIQLESRIFMWTNCLGSYYQGYKAARGKPTRLRNGNRHHVEFIYDEPDDYFTSVVNKIQGELDTSNFTIKYTGAGFTDLI